MLEDALASEELEFVTVDVVDVARANAVEERRFGELDALALQREPFPEKRPHRRETSAGGNEDHRLRDVLLQVEAIRALDEDVQTVALAQRVDVARAQALELALEPR